jgi:hypothetical protein
MITRTFFLGGSPSSPFASAAVLFFPFAAVVLASPPAAGSLIFLALGLAGAFFGMSTGFGRSLIREERRGCAVSPAGFAALRGILGKIEKRGWVVVVGEKRDARTAQGESTKLQPYRGTASHVQCSRVNRCKDRIRKSPEYQPGSPVTEPDILKSYHINDRVSSENNSISNWNLAC